MTYYPVVGPIQTMTSPADQVTNTLTNWLRLDCDVLKNGFQSCFCKSYWQVMMGKPQHIINNMLVSLPAGQQGQPGQEMDGSKTLNLHQVLDQVTAPSIVIISTAIINASTVLNFQCRH